MYKEFGCLRGQTQRFPWGAEVREAESPLLGGDRLHCHVSVFKNKNRTGNSASVWWLVSPPTPTAIPKSFHSVPSICRAVLVNIPSLRKEEESTEKKENPKRQHYTASTHRGRRARGRGRRSVSCPSHSHPVGGGLPTRSRPPPSWQASRWENGVGAEAGLQGTPGGGAVLGTQRTPPPAAASFQRASAWWSPEARTRRPGTPATSRGGGHSGVQVVQLLLPPCPGEN